MAEAEVPGYGGAEFDDRVLLIAVIVVGILLWDYLQFGQDVAGGVADAGGDAYDGTQDVLRGTGDAVSDGADWWLGGGADVVENVGREYGEGYEWVVGGAQDTFEGVVDSAYQAGQDTGEAIDGVLSGWV